MPLHQQVLRVLEGHLSSINARGLLARCAMRAGLDATQMGPDDVPALLDTLRIPLGMYLQGDHLEPVLDEIESLGSST